MDGPKRVKAEDYEGCIQLDRRPPHLRTRPGLNIALRSPPQPVFSLDLTSESRTSHEFIANEVSNVLSSNDYSEFCVQAKEAKQRLERLGIFEANSVELYLQQPPKLLVETVTPPPVLVVEAVERDILRLEAKPSATVTGMNVGAAEIGYEASGMLRNITGWGDLCSGRYIRTKDAPSELHGSISVPFYVPDISDQLQFPLKNLIHSFISHHKPNLNKKQQQIKKKKLKHFPVIMTAEISRDEDNHISTSSFKTESIGGRVKFTSGNHAFGIDNCWRESMPIRRDDFISSSHLGTENNSMKSNSTQKLKANIPSYLWPFSKAKPSMDQKETTSSKPAQQMKPLQGNPIAYASSWPIIDACSSPSVKHSVAYSWQSNQVSGFEFKLPRNNACYHHKSSSMANDDENGGFNSSERSYVLAPGYVPSSGSYRGLSVELAGRGLAAPLIALTSIPNIVNEYCQNDTVYHQQNNININNNKNNNMRTDLVNLNEHERNNAIYGYFGGVRRTIGNILGGDVNYSKWGGCYRYYQELTGPYIYPQPVPSEISMKQSLKNLFKANKLPSFSSSSLFSSNNQGMNENEFIGQNQKHLQKQGFLMNNNNNNYPNNENDSTVKQYGVAAGIVMNMNVNAAILFPYAKQPMTNKSPSNAILCDRLFLGGSKRNGFNSMSCNDSANSSNFYSRTNGLISFLGCENGLRGFETSGIGPRSNMKPTSISKHSQSLLDHHQHQEHSSLHNDQGGSLLGGDALGGNLRLSGSLELSAPLPHPMLASAGFRTTASLQAGLLTDDLAAPLLESVRSSATVGVGLPLGPGSHVEVLFSHPLKAKYQDKQEKWQLSISLGIGS